MESLEPRRVLTAVWTNAENPLDVSADGVVTPNDVLQGINFLNSVGIGPLPDPPQPADEPPPFVDVNCDGVASPQDVLLIINAINGDDVPPTVQATLSNDTAADGSTNADLLTADPTIQGRAEDELVVVSLTAQVDDGTPRGVALEGDGSFSFDPGFSADGSDDGLHTVRLVATDSRGNTSAPFELTFTLDTVGPSIDFDLDAAFDSGVVGDQTTDIRLVELTGQAEMSAIVRPLDAGTSLDVADDGGFNVLGVSLGLGQNAVNIAAIDAAGNETRAVKTFTRQPDSSAIVLTEGNGFADEMLVEVPAGLNEGSRFVSFDLETAFDVSDTTASIEDTFLAYLVDASDPGQTLLDRGEPGTALFRLSGDDAEFAPGLVRFNGTTVEIDVSSLPVASAADLLFQLLDADGDDKSLVAISNIRSINRDARSPSAAISLGGSPTSPGGELDIASLSPTNAVSPHLSNIRFDTESGRHTAELRLRNGPAPIGRTAAVVFPNLPDGVTVANASGVDANGDPYLSLTPAIGRGGLQSGEESTRIPLQIDNPSLLGFSLVTSVRIGAPNATPVLDSIDPISVMPGGYLEVSLSASDADGDRLAYSLRADGRLLNVSLTADGRLIFSPTPEDLGQHSFDVSVSDGALESVQRVTYSVVADADTTTRISGLVLNTDNAPLEGIPVEFGNDETTTAADGSFTLVITDANPAEALKFRGEAFVGDAVYPFVAEKIPLILSGRDLTANVNNVLPRPVFLPALDVDGGTTVDPGQDTTIEQEIAPGEMASVFVSTGTLDDQQGNPFDGVLSITEVPPDLTPAALPPNLFPDVVVTIQPGEMVFSQPAPLTLPNRTGLEPGTLMDLWSINPETGQFDLVGTAEVTSDGESVETIEGGIRNSSWHFVTQQTQQQQANVNPGNNPNNQKQSCEKCEALAEKLRSEPIGGDEQLQGALLGSQAAGGGVEIGLTNGFASISVATSDVELHSGSLREDHFLPTYQSLGFERGVSLHYDSLRADPRPIFHFSSVNVPGSDTFVAALNVRRGNLAIQVPGFIGTEFGLQGGEHFWELPAGINNIDAALQVDLRDQPTGIYEFDVTFGPRRFNGERFVGTASQFTTPVTVVNSTQSPFGAGWGVAGLQQLFETADGSVLLIDGDRTELLFEPKPSGQGFDSPPGDFSVFEKLPDGTYRRTFPDQTVVTFDSGNRIETLTDRNGNQTLFEYDNDGIIHRVVDPAGLMTTFARTGDRITKITDPASRETILDYDGAGNLTLITDADGTSRRFFYDDLHHLTSEIDKRGFRETARFGFHGRVIETIRKDGSRSLFEPAQIIGLFPANLTSDPATAPTLRSSDLNATARFSDPNGNLTTTILDQAGQLQSQFDATGNLPSTVRNPDNLPVVANDGRGNGTYRQFDDRGNVTRITLEQHERSPALFNGLVFPSIADVEMVRLGDLDDDGDLDAVVGHGDRIPTAVSGSTIVTVFENIDGQLIKKLDLGTALDGTENIALADVDGDDILDITIVAGAHTNDRFRVMRGNGDLTFNTLTTIDLAANPSSVVYHDVNRDESPDAIISRTGSTSAILLINDGAGSFTSQSIPVGDRSNDVRLGDVDGDGNVDAVFAGENSLRLLLGDGTGNFTTNLNINDGVRLRQAVALADFTGDGRLDIISTFVGGIQFFENAGAGNFIESAITFAQNEVMSDIAVADLNFDGAVDVIAASNTASGVRVYLNDGFGRFRAQSSFVPAGNRPRSVDVGDLDHDGDFEIVVGNQRSNDFDVVYGKGDGTFLDNPRSVSSAARTAPSMELADINHDGNLDVVSLLEGSTVLPQSSGINTDAISVRLGDGTGGFGTERQFPATTTNAEMDDLALGDVNGDGLFDAAIATGFARGIHILLGQPEGTFGPPVRIPISDVAGAVQMADINKDGLDDIVFANGQRVLIFISNGDGTFSDPQELLHSGGSGLGPRMDDDFQVVDLDGNEALDILLAKGSFRIFLNDGSGNFSLTNLGTGLPGTTVDKVRAADLNNDGFRDLVGIGSGSAFSNDRDGVVVRLSDQAGGFLDSQAFDVGTLTTHGFEIADIDADGNLDVVVSNNRDNSISVAFGDGTGAVSEAQHFRVRIDPATLSIGDLDRDGDLDVATLSDSVRDVTVLLNHSQFSCQQASCGQTRQYDATFSQLIRSTDELGRESLIEIDPANGNTLRETIVFGLPDESSDETDDLVTRFTYTSQGLIDTTIDPLGRITDFDYDAQGRLTDITFAVGTADEAAKSFEYDAAGNLTAEIDELDNRTELQYDEFNRRILVRDALLGEQRFEYDDAGNLVRTLDELGQQTRFEYDTMSRIIRRFDDVGNAASFEYDEFGNVVRRIDRLGREMNHVYDERNRLVETIDAEGGRRVREYDDDNNVIASTDENGNTTRSAYDQRTFRTHLFDALHGLVRLEYDAASNLLQVTDELDRITTFEYDEANRQVAAHLPDPDRDGPQAIPVQRLVFDKAGNVVQEIDPLRNVTHLVYDGRDRMIERIDPDPDGDGPLASPVTRFDYDDRQLLVAVVDPQGDTTRYEYDELDRLVREILPDPDDAGPDTTPIFTTMYDAVGNVIARIDALDNATTYEYDSLNRLMRVTEADPDGDGPLTSPTSSFDYDAEGQVIAATDALDRTTVSEYDVLGRLRTTIQPDPDRDGPLLSPVTRAEYDAFGNVVSITDPRGNITRFEYDPLHRQVRQIEADPDALDVGGDGPLESPVTLSQYDAAGQLTEVTDPLGRTTHLEYDDLGRVVRLVDPDPDRNGPMEPPATTFHFDLVGNLLRQIDPLGNQTEFEYDNLYRIVLETEPDPDGGGPLSSPISRFAYDIESNLTSTIDPLGRITEFVYDSLDRRIRQTDPDPDGDGPALAPVTRLAYDLMDNLLSVEDSLGNTTTFEYDNLYRRVRSIAPDPDGDGPLSSPITRLDYDAVGQLVAGIDPLGRTVSFVFDDLGRTVELIDADPDGPGPLARPVFRRQYDASGNITVMMDALGNIVRHEYDGLDRLVRVIDPDPDGTGPLSAPETRFQYDAADQLREIIDPLQRITQFEFDDLGRQIRRIDPDPDGDGPQQSPSTILTYDLVGNLRSQENALGHQTRFDYDNLYRSTRVTDANGDHTDFAYDAVGNLVTVTDPLLNVTAFEFDGLDRIVRETNELQASRRFIYDTEDNLLETVDRNGRVVRYQYDNLYRTTGESWLEEGQVIREFDFNYDIASQLVGISDPSATYEFTYDGLGRVTSVMQDITGLEPLIELSYAFDAQDNLLNSIATIGGVPDFANDYIYDDFNRLTRLIQHSQAGGNVVAEKRVDFAYDAATQPLSHRRFADAAGTQLVVETAYEFDLAGRLTSLDHAKDGTELAGYSWSFDAANRITSSTSLLDGEADYTHDDRGQLLAANYDFQSDASFTYDENGNRIGNGNTVGVNNRLLSDGTFDYDYDDEGNRIRRTHTFTGAVTDYEWDHRNRLVSVIERDSVDGPATKIVNYGYDAFNRWIHSSVDADGNGPADPANRFFVYDGGQIALEFDGTASGDLAHRYLWGQNVDQLFADEQVESLSSTGSVLWTLADNLGTIRDLATYDPSTDATTIANHRVFDAFGNITSQTNAAVESLFGFTGRPFDKETGLQNNLHRWFDPATGRWMSEDPIGFEAGDANLNRYVANQPLTVTDPDGLAPPAIPRPPSFFEAAVNFGVDVFDLGKTAIQESAKNAIRLVAGEEGLQTLIDVKDQTVGALEGIAGFIKDSAVGLFDFGSLLTEKTVFSIAAALTSDPGLKAELQEGGLGKFLSDIATKLGELGISGIYNEFTKGVQDLINKRVQDYLTLLAAGCQRQAARIIGQTTAEIGTLVTGGGAFVKGTVKSTKNLVNSVKNLVKKKKPNKPQLTKTREANKQKAKQDLAKFREERIKDSVKKKVSGGDQDVTNAFNNLIARREGFKNLRDKLDKVGKEIEERAAHRDKVQKILDEQREKEIQEALARNRRRAEQQRQQQQQQQRDSSTDGGEDSFSAFFRNLFDS